MHLRTFSQQCEPSRSPGKNFLNSVFELMYNQTLLTRTRLTRITFTENCFRMPRSFVCNDLS